MIEQLFHVMHLMGADDDETVIGHALCHHLAELTLRGDVEAVGGLVHQQQTGVGSQSDTHVGLFLLAHRQLTKVHLQGQLESLQTAVQLFATETRIERQEQLHIFVKRDGGQLEILRHDV